MIKLTRSHAPKNMHRFYSLHIAQTLFSQWGLATEWGRIGSPGTVREELFDTKAAAQTALTKRVRIKTRRGYIRSLWESA